DAVGRLPQHGVGSAGPTDASHDLAEIDRLHLVHRRAPYALIPSSRAALPPRIATLSASLNPGVCSMRSTAVFVHGYGKSVPTTSWLAPTSATRWRTPSVLKTIVS